MIVHLIDGTYELFRHFYGIRRFKKTDPPFGAVTGVLHMVVKMIDDGATHIGVATDHIIESFRNQLWPGYKTGAGIERALWAQFHPLEEALSAMGVAVWPMIELEADDALASAAHLAAKDKRVEKVCIWTPDKDLAQCVVADRVALVGDAADGYPGIPGLGTKTAASLINRHGHIEQFPDGVLKNDNLALALLFKDLATLRVDAPLFKKVDELRWRGPTPRFAAFAKKIGDERLLTRVKKLQKLAQ